MKAELSGEEIETVSDCEGCTGQNGRPGSSSDLVTEDLADIDRNTVVAPLELVGPVATDRDKKMDEAMRFWKFAEVLQKRPWLFEVLDGGSEPED